VERFALGASWASLPQCVSAPRSEPFCGTHSYGNYREIDVSPYFSKAWLGNRR